MEKFVHPCKSSHTPFPLKRSIVLTLSSKPKLHKHTTNANTSTLLKMSDIIQVSIIHVITSALFQTNCFTAHLSIFKNEERIVQVRSDTTESHILVSENQSYLLRNSVLWRTKHNTTLKFKYLLWIVNHHCICTHLLFLWNYSDVKINVIYSDHLFLISARGAYRITKTLTILRLKVAYTNHYANVNFMLSATTKYSKYIEQSILTWRD